MDYTGTGNTLNSPPADAAADHGQPPLLGRRTCTWTASASTWPPPWRANCTRSTSCGAFFDIIHQDPVLRAGEAHRRALGRGPGRLSGRQLPGRLDASGTASTATTCGASGRGDAGQVARAGLPARRQQRPLRAQRPRPAREHQLRHLPRRLHPARPGQLRRTSTTRPTARTTATAPTTTSSRNCGVEGPTDDPAIVAHARAAEAQSACHARLLPGRADAARAATSSAAPSRATTTPTARTTRSPGWTGGSHR